MEPPSHANFVWLCDKMRPLRGLLLTARGAANKKELRATVAQLEIGVLNLCTTFSAEIWKKGIDASHISIPSKKSYMGKLTTPKLSVEPTAPIKPMPIKPMPNKQAYRFAAPTRTASSSWGAKSAYSATPVTKKKAKKPVNRGTKKKRGKVLPVRVTNREELMGYLKLNRFGPTKRLNIYERFCCACGRCPDRLNPSCASPIRQVVEAPNRKHKSKPHFFRNKQSDIDKMTQAALAI